MFQSAYKSSHSTETALLRVKDDVLSEHVRKMGGNTGGKFQRAQFLVLLVNPGKIVCPRLSTSKGQLFLTHLTQNRIHFIAKSITENCDRVTLDKYVILIVV